MSGPSVHERIKQLRMARGWSLNKLALLTDLSQGYLSGVENGKIQSPSGQALAKIATALGTSIDYLMGTTDNPSPPSRVGPLSPSDHLNQIDIHLRGMGITEDDIALIKQYLTERQRQHKRGTE